jgi:hypothetical protein
MCVALVPCPILLVADIHRSRRCQLVGSVSSLLCLWLWLPCCHEKPRRAWSMLLTPFARCCEYGLTLFVRCIVHRSSVTRCEFLCDIANSWLSSAPWWFYSCWYSNASHARSSFKGNNWEPLPSREVPKRFQWERAVRKCTTRASHLDYSRAEFASVFSHSVSSRFFSFFPCFFLSFSRATMIPVCDYYYARFYPYSADVALHFGRVAPCRARNRKQRTARREILLPKELLVLEWVPKDISGNQFRSLFIDSSETYAANEIAWRSLPIRRT